MHYGRRCCRALVALVWLAGETLSMQGEGEESATGGQCVLVLEAKIPTRVIVYPFALLLNLFVVDGDGGWEAFEFDG